MGYTHYWKIPSETQAVWEKHWPLLVMDARVFVQAAGVRLRKSIDDDAIDLNGYDESHEDFVLKPICIDFDCCKTAGKDYDISVSAILLRASQLSGQAIQVSSDGDWDYEWMEARELVSKLWPIDDMKCPWDEEGGGESEEEMEEMSPMKDLKCDFKDNDGKKCGCTFHPRLRRALDEHIRLEHKPMWKVPYSCPLEGCKAQNVRRPDNAGDHFRAHLKGKSQRHRFCTLEELTDAMHGHACWPDKRITKMLRYLRKCAKDTEEQQRVREEQTAQGCVQ